MPLEVFAYCNSSRHSVTFLWLEQKIWAAILYSVNGSSVHIRMLSSVVIFRKVSHITPYLIAGCNSVQSRRIQPLSFMFTRSFIHTALCFYVLWFAFAFCKTSCFNASHFFGVVSAIVHCFSCYWLVQAFWCKCFGSDSAGDAFFATVCVYFTLHFVGNLSQRQWWLQRPKGFCSLRRAVAQKC